MKHLIISVLLMMTASIASAGIITFDEGVAVQTGTISYDGNGGALTGTDILFTTSTGDGTAVNPGAVNSLSCVDCYLNFTTGLNTLEGPALWQWLAGGSFSLDGDLYSGATLLTSGNLLSGLFTETPIAAGNGLGNGNALFLAVGDVTGAPELGTYFGEPGTGFDFAYTSLALQSCGPAGGSGGFDCGVQNADLALTAAVPVPATGLLFGIGAAGLIASRKRWQ